MKEVEVHLSITLFVKEGEHYNDTIKNRCNKFILDQFPCGVRNHPDGIEWATIDIDDHYISDSG